MNGIAELYLAAHQSFVDLARSLSDDDWATPVPCLPGWDVRDVLSHVSGVPDDALAGRLDGVATEPWTASQVERNRHLSVDGLLGRWADQAPAFAEAVAAMDERRPPFDCHTHEHDIRHALGRPANRDSAIVAAAAEQLAVEFDLDFPVTIRLSDGPTVSNGPASADPDGGVTIGGLTTFELFRSRIGRRTRDQVLRYDWSGSDHRIAAVLDGWFIFGPAPADIIE